jgi:hypothetical protein
MLKLLGKPVSILSDTIVDLRNQDSDYSIDLNIPEGQKFMPLAAFLVLTEVSSLSGNLTVILDVAPDYPISSWVLRLPAAPAFQKPGLVLGFVGDEGPNQSSSLFSQILSRSDQLRLRVNSAFTSGTAKAKFLVVGQYVEFP